MPTTPHDDSFDDAISRVYASHLVPLIFEPYATALAQRLAERAPRSVLEIAAGTGVVTRALAATLPEDVAITATDLSQPMLDEGARRGTTRPVRYQQADALRLPFADASFDAVVCQFGAMFFADRPRAYAEARRVLRAGGAFLFSVWGAIADNEIADEVTRALAALWPDDPPRFMARVPHGYHDRATIARELALGGFPGAPRWETVAARSVATSAHVAAVAYCQGTPLRTEIEARDPAGLARATDAAAEAIACRFGAGPVDAKIQAHVIAVER